MALLFGLLAIPMVAGTISWKPCTDGTNGVWSLSCDFYGQDLSSAKVPGEQCGSKCKATAGCTHFTWTNYNGGTCWMKTGPAFRTDAMDKNDNAMVCGLLPSWSQDWANGCDFAGNDMGSANTINSQCGPKCQSTPGCTHFTWTNYQGGKCWMKSGAATGLTAKSDNTMVCGIVGGSTPPPGPGPTPGGGRVITVKNNCPEPIWMESNLDGVRKVDRGQTITYNIPKGGWKSGRMWPKIRCDGAGNNCFYGQSRTPCPSTGCTPPADTLAEFTIEAEGGGNTWYDISLVDGYSLPIKIVPRGTSSGTCVATNCAVDLNQCPSWENNGLGDLHYRKNGEVVACFSPCKRWTYPSPAGMAQSERTPTGMAMCCPSGVSSEACNAGDVSRTKYVELIHRTCPTAYSFAYDDKVGLHQCNSGTSFDITVC